MTTDLDRLKAWMAQNGHDSQSLSKAVGYANNAARRILAEKVPVGLSFKWLFAKAFGDETAAAIFEFPVPSAARLGLFRPERDAAHRKVNWKMSREIIPPANQSCCCICRKRQAEHNHHPSYEVEEQLTVYPLCRSCHTKVHKGSAKLQLRLKLDGTPIVYPASKQKRVARNP